MILLGIIHNKYPNLNKNPTIINLLSYPLLKMSRLFDHPIWVKGDFFVCNKFKIWKINFHKASLTKEKGPTISACNHPLTKEKVYRSIKILHEARDYCPQVPQSRKIFIWWCAVSLPRLLNSQIINFSSSIRCIEPPSSGKEVPRPNRTWWSAQ